MGKCGAGCGEQEAQIEALLEELGIDLIVLARYMQIFSEEFCSRHAMHTINIHHSFLPAFEGAPHHSSSFFLVSCISSSAQNGHNTACHSECPLVSL